jgi:hypothetical protein
METKTKSGFTVIQMVEIPENNLSKAILKELSGREMFVDTDENLGEQIFSGDIFEQIASEQFEMSISSPLRLSSADLVSISKLADELNEYELVRINKI